MGWNSVRKPRLILWCLVCVFGGALSARAETVRLLHNGHLPKKVLVVLTNQTRQFVAGLIDIIAAIHEQDSLTGHDAFKLHVLSSSRSERQWLPTTPDKLSAFVEFNDELFVQDIWMQDIGEFCAIARNGTWTEGIFDSKRGRGLAEVMPWLAKAWNQTYVANPSRNYRAGDYGGNIEVTPDNILYYGDTMSEACEKFLLESGYQNRSIKLQTSWLKVGHIDEYLTIIPSRHSRCGYSIVRADPWYALDLIDGAGEADFNAMPREMGEFLKRVQAALRDPDHRKGTPEADFIELNRQIGELIEANISRLVSEIRRITGDTARDIPIMAWPTVFHNFNRGTELKHCIAYTPGVVNHLVLRDHLVVPDPFFPPFKRTVEARFRAQGNRVHFLNDLPYHDKHGEVHCGTNVRRDVTRTLITPQFTRALAALGDTFDRVHRDAR